MTPLRARVFVTSSSTGRVALLERRRGSETYWVVPGGGIEEGETPEEAAVREVLEELGLTVALERAVLRREDQVFFLAYVDGEPALVLGGPESLRVSEDNQYLPQWVTLREAAELPGRISALHDWLRQVAMDGWPRVATRD